MIRIKYNRINDYLVSVKNFSTNAHEELIYVVINQKTFRYGFVSSSNLRTSDRLSSLESSFVSNGTSLVDTKKKVKKDLIGFGVNFDVEVRNPRVTND